MIASIQVSGLPRWRVLAVVLVAAAAASLFAATTAAAVTITELSNTMTAGSSPYKIVAGPDANMWYTDVDGARIGRITPSGAVTEFPTPTADSMPGGITAAPDGNLWFTELAGTVGKITPAGVITETPMGDILLEGGIAVGPDDNLWITGLLHPDEDTYIPAIVRMTLDGEATTFTAGLSTDAVPAGITRGPDDNMWFTDASGRIGRITPTGVVSEL